MEYMEEILPSARLFIGPGDELFGFDKLWILVLRGSQWVIGRRGDDELQELQALSIALGYNDIDDAWSSLTGMLRGIRRSALGYSSYHTTPAQRTELKGDAPTVWTVDFDQQRVFHDRDGGHLVYNFTLPEIGPLKMRMVQPYAPMDPPIKKSTMSMIESELAAPADVVPKQLYDLVYRIASDYEFNWRDIGFSIKRHGLHSLAMGILSCFTLNFRSELIAVSDCAGYHHYTHQKRPKPEAIVRWRVWPTPPIIPTVKLGSTYVLFTERMDDAMSLVYDHYWESGMHECQYDTIRPQPMYIVSSVREIQCFKCVVNTLRCTRVEPFFDGQNPPSETGVRWLLNAIHGHAYPLLTRIHNLPLELQEMILDYTSDGSEINRAYYSGILGFGFLFDWKSNGVPLRRLKLDNRRILNRDHAEHQVLFWNEFVGVSYQADDRTNASAEWEWDTLECLVRCS